MGCQKADRDSKDRGKNGCHQTNGDGFNEFPRFSAWNLLAFFRHSQPDLPEGRVNFALLAENISEVLAWHNQLARFALDFINYKVCGAFPATNHSVAVFLGRKNIWVGQLS